MEYFLLVKESTIRKIQYLMNYVIIDQLLKSSLSTLEFGFLFKMYPKKVDFLVKLISSKTFLGLESSNRIFKAKIYETSICFTKRGQIWILKPPP